MQKKTTASNGSKKKERHIVTWSQEEDDILREQISIHGTDNWAIIASKFKDKTTRQCRRRWYTYLNSDFKKGGWSPEEDLLLCEVTGAPFLINYYIYIQLHKLFKFEAIHYLILLIHICEIRLKIYGKINFEV
ncbi:hypothetical protein SAY86_016771 [Trapa natans]|uniref:Uncharacterized protein n=1 Tax=Trapa natans TaxID=22666 RepID=A0AAN7R4I3_TRANT|nr:hypothetical protein SAY86_016771 [Trapa natans]